MHQTTPHTSSVYLASFNENPFPIGMGKYSQKLFYADLNLAVTAEMLFITESTKCFLLGILSTRYVLLSRVSSVDDVTLHFVETFCVMLPM